MRLYVTTMLLVLLSIGQAVAAVDGISVSLAGGEVVGPVKGQGKASVRATIVNESGRALSSIVLGVFYNSINELPGGDAAWIKHAFEFDPPLGTGKSVTVKFTDNNALEYIMLDVQSAQLGWGISYNGRLASPAPMLELRDDVWYISTRDLMELVGGGLSYDPKTYMVGLERAGVLVQVKPKLGYALVGGAQQRLEHPVVEIDGRSLVPLVEIALLLGLSASVDEAQQLLLLEGS